MRGSSRRPPGTVRGPGSYTSRACSVCRHKKIKCDGGKPSCESCVNGGRADECTYSKEVGRRPRSEGHYQALRSQISLLFKYIHHLESLLDQCQRDHPGSLACGYRQHRPEHWEEPESPERLVPEVPEEEDDSENSDVANELCLPTQNLRLEEGGLLLHGATAPWRYSSEPMRASIIPRQWAISENPDESYTLRVDGSDDAHFDPNFDWSRHLPPEVHMDRVEHDRILDLVFKFFTSWCLRIVPPLFLRDMYRALKVPKTQTAPRLSHYSPMLHNAILALGTAFSDVPTLRDLKTRLYFLDKAKSYIEVECSRPHISVVNALSLIASFYSSQGDQTLGFVYFGMSACIGQALGLKVDCGSWVGTVITEEDQVDRNWTYWTTYCQDVYWSFYVGREFCIPTTSKNVPIPFVDADFDKLDWYHAPSGISSQPGYMSKTFSSTCELSMITKDIMDVVNVLDGPGNRQMVLDPKISEIDLALHRWHDNLPDELSNTIRMRTHPTPHLLQLHLTFHWSFILLHRPFYRRRSKSVVTQEGVIDHAKICKRSADAIMDFLGIWRQYFTLRYVPITLIQTIFGAGTIYLLSALQSVEGARVANKELGHAMSKTLECVQYLKEAGESWPCATKIANILRDWQYQTKPKIRERTTFSPFASGTLPPKQPVILIEGRSHDSMNEDSEAVKRKHKVSASGEGSRKRQRSGSGSSISRTASESSSRALAPSISVSSSSGSRNEHSSVALAVNQPLQLPTPLSLPPPSPQHQSSFQFETASPLLSSPYHATTPLPSNSTQHLQLQPPAPSISSRTSSPLLPFVSSPQPQPWNALSEEVLPLPDVQPGRSVSPPMRPSAPHPRTHVSAQASPSTPHQRQSSSSATLMHHDKQGTDLDLNILDPNIASQSSPLSSPSKTTHSGVEPTVNAPSNNQLPCPNYHLYAPGSIFTRRPLPSINTNPLLPTPSSVGGASGIIPNNRNANEGGGLLETQQQMLLSPTSYQMAMPNGQRFWEMPFFPISYGPEFGDETSILQYLQMTQVRRAQQQQQQQAMQEGDNPMTALSELGFEFVTKHAASEGAGFVMRGGDNDSGVGGGDGGGGGNATREGQNVDVDMTWEGREGWEDISGEDFMNWLEGGG